MRIPKSNSLIKWPVNLHYPIEYKESLNVEQEALNKQCNQELAQQEAAIIDEMKRQFTEDRFRAFFAGRMRKYEVFSCIQRTCYYVTRDFIPGFYFIFVNSI